MLRSHKIRLDPNQAQANHFARACGTARFAWNWALEQWQVQFAASKANPSLARPNEASLRRQLNAIKREQFPWMLEVTKCAPQEAIRSLGVAYSNWFSSMSGKRSGPKIQAPRPKLKGRHDAFKVDGAKVAVEGSRIRIPRLGWVRMREPARFAGRFVSCTVSRTAHAWFVSITVDTEQIPVRTESQGAVGIDLGLHRLATESNGRITQPVKALGMRLNQLRRLSRAHSRKVKGSANRRKSAARLARLHWKIACVRSDAMHKLTDQLTRDNGWIAIEDLNVRGMLGNGRLARHLSDASFGEFRRQLTYKCAQRGVYLATVDRFFPSSKTCSACMHVHTGLKLSDRNWICAACGAEHDRDLNAARNILAQSLADAANQSAGGGPVAACEEESSGSRRKTRVQLASSKQEVKSQD